MTKRAVIYVRVSTDEQSEHGYSLLDQRERCERYANTHDFNVLDVFQDDISGDYPMDARPGGAALLAELQNVEAVIVATADRLSRNLAHSLVIRQQWQRAGLEIHFADKGVLADTPEGRLTANVEAIIAEYEREKIRLRTMTGKRQKVKAGHWLGIHTPFGYIREGKGRDATIMIDLIKSKVVRDIFTWYTDTERMPLEKIIGRLQAAGIETANGGKWQRSTVNKMLKNSVYAGWIEYGKTHLRAKRTDTEPTWTRAVKTAPEERVRVDLPELAIIDLQTFQAAQERAKQNADLARRNRSGQYLMSGFLRCSVCGKSMVGHPNRTKMNYRCNNLSCAANSKTVICKKVDTQVWAELLELLSDESKLRAGLTKLADKRSLELSGKQAELDTIKEMIDLAENKITRLTRDYKNEKDDFLAGVIHESMAQEAKTRAALVERQKKIETDLSGRAMTLETQNQIFALALQVGEKMQGDPTNEQKRIFFRALEVVVTLDLLSLPRTCKVDCALGEGVRRLLGEKSCIPNTDWVDTAKAMRISFSFALDFTTETGLIMG